MPNQTLGYILLAGLIVTIATAVWLHWRYARYLRAKRSGTGRRDIPAVWKPFWFN